jgi:hypothetical protein
MRRAVLWCNPSMKTSLRSYFALVLLSPVALLAASFEGKVDFKMTTGRETQQMSYNIKGDKIRIDMPGQKGMGGIIIEPAKKETTIMMDEQKMYMTMAMPDVAAQAAEAKAGDVKFEKTGETEKILGYAAEKYISTYQGVKTEMWLAEGLGTFMSFSNSNPMGGGRRGSTPASQGWEKMLAGKDLFPLRVVSKEKDGKESFKMEATAINKQSLSDSLFAPPADYQKLDMGAMMKGMMPNMGR